MIGDYTPEQAAEEIRAHTALGIFPISPCLFIPPPGVNPYNAYAKVFSACFAVWITAAWLVAVL